MDTLNIIEHHSHFDFDSYLKRNDSFVAIGEEDLEAFERGSSEMHSFIGEADRDDRVMAALANALSAEGAAEIVGRSKRLAVFVDFSPEGGSPLLMKEIEGLTGFFDSLPKDCEVMWSAGRDASLGDAVRIVVLAGI